MQELVLILSSLAGVAVAATVRRIPKTKNQPTSLGVNSQIKDQITSLKIEKDLLHKTIARLYKTNSNTVKTQKDRLLSKYQYQLEIVSEKLNKLEQAKNHPDFGLIGDSLSTLLDQKLSKLDDRLHELSSKIQTSKNEQQKIKQNISKQSGNNLNKTDKQNEPKQISDSSINSGYSSKLDDIAQKTLNEKPKSAITVQKETNLIAKLTVQPEGAIQTVSDNLKREEQTTFENTKVLPKISVSSNVTLEQKKNTLPINEKIQKQAALSGAEDKTRMTQTAIPKPRVLPKDTQTKAAPATPHLGVLPKDTQTKAAPAIIPKPGVLPKDTQTKAALAIIPKPGVLPKDTQTKAAPAIIPKPGVLPKDTQTKATLAIIPKPGVLPKDTQTKAAPAIIPKPGVLPKDTQTKAAPAIIPKPGVLPKDTQTKVAPAIIPKPGVLPKDTQTKATLAIIPKPGVLPKDTQTKATLAIIPKPGVLPKDTQTKAALMPKPRTFPDLDKISQKPATSLEPSKDTVIDDEFGDDDGDDLDVIKKDIAKILTKLDQAEVE